MATFPKQFVAPSLAGVPTPPPSVLALVILWYVVSFSGIIVNKIVLSQSAIEPAILAFTQTACTTAFGWITVRTGGSSICSGGGNTDSFLRNLSIFIRLGLLRFLTVVLGLISLKHVAASFTETVKASSPIFTVSAAFLLTGERTNLQALLTLIPVMGGLMLASANEISFTTTGFLAAVAANVVDCMQNVFGKTLLHDSSDPSGVKSSRYSALQLQYLSSLAALVVQSPFFCWQMSQGQIHFPSEMYDVVMLITASLIYFAQSSMVFGLMSYFSPVTVSVLNTVKRALIICMSAVYFGNVITPLSGAGMFVTVFGGCLYGWVRSRTPTPKRVVGDEHPMTRKDSGTCNSEKAKASPSFPPSHLELETGIGMRHQQN